jgi:hypothetical protein
MDIIGGWRSDASPDTFPGAYCSQAEDEDHGQ